MDWVRAIVEGIEHFGPKNDNDDNECDAEDLISIRRRNTYVNAMTSMMCHCTRMRRRA